MMETEIATVNDITKLQKQKQDQEGSTERDISTRLLSDESACGVEIHDVGMRAVSNGDTGKNATCDKVEIVDEAGSRSRLIYRIAKTPPFYLLILYALQQALMIIVKPLTATVIISQVTCAQKDEYIKTQIISASFLITGLATFMVTTFGVRLPIFQIPSHSFLLPLIVMSSTEEWGCPDMLEDNTTIFMAKIDNVTAIPIREMILSQVSKLSGSLMLVGGIHFLIGLTGLVGIFMRNLAIIGTSIMLGLMLPHWLNTRPGVLDTGNADDNNCIHSFVSNPAAVGGVYACLLDNIIPGSLKERGLLHQMKDLDDEDAKRLAKTYDDGPEVYRLPFIPPSFYRSKFLKYVPVFEYTGQ